MWFRLGAGANRELGFVQKCSKVHPPAPPKQTDLYDSRCYRNIKTHCGFRGRCFSGLLVHPSTKYLCAAVVWIVRYGQRLQVSAVSVGGQASRKLLSCSLPRNRSCRFLNSVCHEDNEAKPSPITHVMGLTESYSSSSSSSILVDILLEKAAVLHFNISFHWILVTDSLDSVRL